MRLVFAGTPVFAATALHTLHAAGFELALVLTQPDRPAGRGMKLQASPVKQWALAHGVGLAQPRSLRLDGKYPQDAAQALALLQAARADVMVVAAYGLILPQWVLELFPLGCLNIHASLLPRWRGAAPIQRAIEAGDTETGITLMQMDAGLDTGDMLLHEAVPIAPDDSTASLHDRLADVGARLIVQALRQAQAVGGRLPASPQPAQGVSYAHKIDKAETLLDWQQPAAVLERKIRAFHPQPGAQTGWQGEPLKITRSQIDSYKSSNDKACGTILSVSPDAVTVQCGLGSLALLELQRAGGKRLPVHEFLRGHPLTPGTVLGQP